MSEGIIPVKTGIQDIYAASEPRLDTCFRGYDVGRAAYKEEAKKKFSRSALKDEKILMKRIVFTGVGGQSVRVISHVLALALKELGYEVALLFDYDSSVRNTRISAYLTYDQRPIEDPMIDEADILIRLHEKGDPLVAQKTICDTGLCTDEEVPFGMLGIEKFGLAIFGNMIALGRLFRLIDLDISHIELEKLLPKSYLKENLKAIQLGYDLNLYED